MPRMGLRRAGCWASSIWRTTRPGRQRYAERMRRRAVEESLPQSAAAREALRRGWCLGGASFRERMLGRLEKTSEKISRGKQLDGVVRRGHNDDEAGRLLRAGLQHYGLEAAQLGALRKGDPRKLALARLIRQHHCD